MRPGTGNQEFVAGLVHGRRSRMAEGPRLRDLCQAQNLAEFTGDLGIEPVLGKTPALQLTLINRLADEIDDLAGQFSGAAAELLRWLGVRFRVENLKLLVRRLMTRAAPESVTPHLATTRGGVTLNLEALAKSDSIEALAKLLPAGWLRRTLAKAADVYREQPRSFLYEGVLDKAYFQEGLRRAGRLPAAESALIQPMLMQETDIFHLMLVTRGKLIYRLAPAALLPLHVPGTRVPRSLFTALLAESELSAVANHILGRVLDGEPTGPSQGAETQTEAGSLEALAWNRFRRLANRAFRQSHMGLAAVVAYLELRRIEAANLISIFEGLRRSVPREYLHARLIPRAAAPAATTHA